MRHKGQPKCRPTHEHSGREGQTWHDVYKVVTVNDPIIRGVTLKTKKCIGHFKCKKCQADVIIDDLSEAYCPKCGDIFKDPNPSLAADHALQVFRTQMDLKARSMKGFARSMISL